MVLLIDNYDSFTYNLKQYLMELGQDVTVARNDAITCEEIKVMNPSHIVISPGPGRPEDAGISVEIVKNFSGVIPILGVCLGHQAIALAFGASIVQAKNLMHGKTSVINHTGRGVFNDLPHGLTATRYHSLVVKEDTLTSSLEISAKSEDGEIMGLRHREHLTEGVQFHPESILTPEGQHLLSNFLEFTYEKKAETGFIKIVLQDLIDGKNLSTSQASEVMSEIMEGRATPSQISGLLTALRIKGETVDEIVSFARVMRQKAVRVNPSVKGLVDTCGTGGDCTGTFNISTAAALVTAGEGIPVAKHGNRSISSRSGSADVLEALNVNIDLSPEDIARCIEETGIGFLFAPKLHPAMKYAIGPRRELGVRTVFNILGPLTNPAGASYQMMGVYDIGLVETIARVLHDLGVVRGFVAASADGLDEVSVCDETFIAEFSTDGVKTMRFSPDQVGYPKSPAGSLRGGDAKVNADIITRILEGEKGPRREAVCLNAGFAIAAARGCAIDDGVRLAEESIDNGSAKRTLKSLIEFSNSV